MVQNWFGYVISSMNPIIGSWRGLALGADAKLPTQQSMCMYLESKLHCSIPSYPCVFFGAPKKTLRTCRFFVKSPRKLPLPSLRYWIQFGETYPQPKRDLHRTYGRFMG